MNAPVSSDYIEEDEILPVEEIQVAQGIKHEPINRDNIKREIPPVHKLLLSCVGILTYLGTYVIDALLLHEYYEVSRWTWFLFTLVCFLLPTIIIQLLSCKWFYDDHGTLNFYTIVLHLLCLGPVERYCYIIFNGAMARRRMKNASSEKGIDNLVKYLVNWRDVSMLRFLYAFLESGPQITLQLYVLMQTLIRKYDVEHTTLNAVVDIHHAVVIIKIGISIGALACGMVSYNSDLRDTEGKHLSIPGYIFQSLYRLLIITSRVATLVLFAMQFKYLVLAVVFVHWLLMFFWVKHDNFLFFTKKGATCNNVCETAFQIILGYIYIFCYIATKDGSTAKSQLVFYLLFFVENICMMIAWVTLNGRDFDRTEISVIAFVASTMILGILFHAVYYRCFHPSLERKGKESIALHNGEEEEEGVDTLIVKENCFFERVDAEKKKLLC